MNSMPELAYVNGVFGPVCEARVSIEDRGFQFGDAVYEVIVAYNRKPFLLDHHLRRLRSSLAGIALAFDFEACPLEPIIAEGLGRCEFSDAMIYLQITRGVAPRSHVIPAGMKPTVVMTFKALPVIPDELRRTGVQVITTVDTRWANCYIKAVTLLPNVLAKNEAIRRGCYDAIFVTAAGEVRECTSANLFVIQGGIIRIPPRTQSILHGVTQGYLLDLVASLAIEVREEPIDVPSLRSADEVFMSGTASEVLAITTIDDLPVGNGRVGPITRRLSEEFIRRTRS